MGIKWKKVFLIWAPFLTFKKWGSSFESLIDFDLTLKWTNKRTTHYAMVHGPFYFVTNPNHRWTPLFGLSLSPFEEPLPYPTLTTSVGGRGYGATREGGNQGGWVLAYLFKGHLGFYSRKRKRQCLGPPIQFFTKFQNQV